MTACNFLFLNFECSCPLLPSLMRPSYPSNFARPQLGSVFYRPRLLLTYPYVCPMRGLLCIKHPNKGDRQTRTCYCNEYNVTVSRPFERRLLSVRNLCRPFRLGRLCRRPLSSTRCLGRFEWRLSLPHATEPL